MLSGTGTHEAKTVMVYTAGEIQVSKMTGLDRRDSDILFCVAAAPLLLERSRADTTSQMIANANLPLEDL